MSLKLFVFFCFSPVVLFAHREATYCLIGTCRGGEICLRLDEFGDACFARYYSSEILTDRVLSGYISTDSVFYLHSYDWDSIAKKNILKDSIVLKEIKNDVWRGVWMTEDSSSANFAMRPIIVDSLNVALQNIARKLPLDSYSKYRLQYADIKMKKKQKMGEGIWFQRMVERKSGVELFQLKEKGGNVFDSVNSTLYGQCMKMADGAFSCSTVDGVGLYRTKFAVYFANKELLSYSVSVSSSCYGGAMQAETKHVTVSVENAEQIMLEDLFWFTDSVYEPMNKGEYEWFQYRYKDFAPVVYNLLRQNYPDMFSLEDQCDICNEKYWSLPEWYIADNGLWLKATGNSMVDGAFQWFLLPYESIARYMIGKFALP